MRNVETALLRKKLATKGFRLNCVDKNDSSTEIIDDFSVSIAVNSGSCVGVPNIGEDGVQKQILIELRWLEEVPQTLTVSHPQPADVELWSMFWIAIVNQRLYNDEEFLQFTDSRIEWDRKVASLMVRDQYEHIWTRITTEQHNMILVLGTPGVGKSLFAVWLMYKIAREIPEPRVVFQDRNGDRFLFTIESGVPTVRDYASVGGLSLTHFISDTSKPPESLGVVVQIHVSSYNNKPNYQNFQKLILSVRSLTVTMAPFSADEALKLGRKLGMSDADIRFKHDIFGGAARYLFGVASKKSKSTHEVEALVTLAMSSYFCDVDADWSKDCWTGCYNLLVAILTDVDSSQDMMKVSSLFVHFYTHDPVGEQSVLDWASDFLKWTAGVVMEKKSKEIMTALASVLEGQGMGKLHEYTAHHTIYNRLCNGSRYFLYPLPVEDHVGNIIEMGGERDLQPTKRMLIRNIDSFSEVPDRCYAKPVFSNYPVVDAVLRMGNLCYLFQMTVSDTHKGKTTSVETLEAIKSKLRKAPEGAALRFLLVFVLLDENYYRFGEQSGLGDIQQVKTFVEPTSKETGLPSSKQGPQWGVQNRARMRAPAQDEAPAHEAPAQETSAKVARKRRKK